MKKAIILAAGVGSRIKKYHEKPKALLEFGKNKITIILCGGGRKNKFLLKNISKHTKYNLINLILLKLELN